MKIRCTICGNVFEQKTANHLQGQGCPFCKRSFAERRIESYLKNKNIKFEIEKWFNNCRGIKKPLPFDFYLPDYNMCIEYDGKQHFEPIDFSKGKQSKEEILEQFKNLKRNDFIKTKFCLENDISLVRIPYYERNRLESFLDFYFVKEDR